MDTEIRALTVRNPWAWAIAHGGKTVENRGRATHYRGLLAIHAGSYARWDVTGEESQLVQQAWIEWTKTLPLRNVATAQMRRTSLHVDHSAVVAVAELAGDHPDWMCIKRGPGAFAGCRDWGTNAGDGQHHWLLWNVRSLPEPVPCKGALGLWRLPDDVEKAVQAQLEAVHA